MSDAFDDFDPDIVWDYFKDHTIAETEKHFGVTHYRFTKFIKKHSLQKATVSKKKLDAITGDEFRDYYFSHSIDETISHFKLSYREFRLLCEKNDAFKQLVRKRQVEEITKTIDLNELTVLYRSSTLNEVAAKYFLSSGEMQAFLGESNIKKSPYPPFEEEFLGVDPNEVEAFYSTHTRRATADFFGLDEGRLRLFLKRNNLLREGSGYCGDEITNSNRLKTLRDEFWSDPVRTKLSFEKAQDTMEERYGDRNYNLKRMAEGVFDKYGVKSVGQLPEVQKKAQDTLFQRYGVLNPGLVNWGAKQSKEELSLAPALALLGLVCNDFSAETKPKPFFKRFPSGQHKCPDYFDWKNKIAVEYNGSFWHKDIDEPKRWVEMWASIGWKVGIIWDFEREALLSDPPKTVEELLERYPSTYRQKDT